MGSLHQFQERISREPYDYEAHLSLLSLLSTDAQADGGPKELLAAARRHAASLFPLSPDLWEAWLRDEAPGLSPEGLHGLLDAATTDYVSVDLWLFILTLIITGDEEDMEDVEKHRATFPLDVSREWMAKAVASAGSHFSRGYLVWERVFHFELELLKRDPQPDAIKKLRTRFQERLKARQGSQGLDKLMVQYSGFESALGGEAYISHMQAASMAVAKCKKENVVREDWETQLSQAALSGRTLGIYEKYIAFERKQKNPDKLAIRSLYERAILEFPTHAAVWISFISFLATEFLIEPVILSVALRATRNCFWDAAIWTHALRLMASFKKPKEDIQDLVENAVRATRSFAPHDQIAQMVLGYCDTYYWQCAMGAATQADHVEAFETARSLLKKYSVDDSNAYLMLTQAKFMATETKNEEAARQIYLTLSQRKGHLSSVWLEYFNFEQRSPGFMTQCRNLLKKASQQKNMDKKEAIFNAASAFEIKYGNVATYYAFVGRAHGMSLPSHPGTLQHADAMDTTETIVAELDGGSELNQTSKRPINGSPMGGDYKRQKAVTSGKDLGKTAPSERPTEKIAPVEYHITDNLMAGNMIYIPELDGRVDQELIQKEFSQFGKITDLVMQPNGETGVLEAYIEFENADQVRAVAAKGPRSLVGSDIRLLRCRPSQELWNFQAEEEPRKIYVSNLSTLVEKKTLREAFSVFGKIKEIRLVMRQSTSFAYIEFESVESAQESLAMDQKSIEEGRVLRVAISNPAKHTVKELDEREIFISNLPHSLAGEEDVTFIFKTFGEIKQVRVVRDERGRSKGIAFVSFVDVASAKAALSMNGSQVEGRILVVSISDPNVRARRKVETYGRRGESRGGSRGGRGMSSRVEGESRPPLKPFVPRTAVAKTKQRTRVAMVPSTSATAMVVDLPIAQTETPASKTQDDFRRLLGRGKQP